MKQLEGVALNLYNYRHFSEHLAPICVLLGIPLLLSDATEAAFLQNIYPGLTTTVWEREAFSLSLLFDTFSLFVQSEYWPRPKWEEAKANYGKRWKNHYNLHCPHGFSDKRFWLAQAAKEDGTLYYGSIMQSWLREEGMEEKRQIWCSNYRASYYQNNRSLMDAFCQKEVFDRFQKKQPCLLYAPTCLDQELSTTFFEASTLLDNLPSEYNLLVKLHPALIEKAPWEVGEFMHRYRSRSNLVILDQFPLVYPILQQIDGYIGDLSSMGYDFLGFGKPMFFLKNGPLTPPRLLEGVCLSLPVEKASQIYALLDQPPNVPQQRALYLRAFGPSLSWIELSCLLPKQIQTWMDLC